MAENTKNLNLKKPAPEEFYNISDFNENFQKIDDYMENLSEVDNTADVNKPVSTAQAEAIAKAKEEAVSAAQADSLLHTVNTNNPHGVTKAQLGLGNVDNTSDANKPVSTAQASAIADAKKSGTDAQ